jgi:hypothetical protein
MRTRHMFSLTMYGVFKVDVHAEGDDTDVILRRVHNGELDGHWGLQRVNRDCDWPLTVCATLGCYPTDQRKGVRHPSALTLIQRQRHCELRSAFGAIHRCYAASVNTNNCLNEGQSQSVVSR